MWSRGCFSRSKLVDFTREERKFLYCSKLRFKIKHSGGAGKFRQCKRLLVIWGNQMQGGEDCTDAFSQVPRAMVSRIVISRATTACTPSILYHKFTAKLARHLAALICPIKICELRLLEELQGFEVLAGAKHIIDMRADCEPVVIFACWLFDQHGLLETSRFESLPLKPVA